MFIEMYTQENLQQATSLLATSNRLVATSYRKPSERILISVCCNKLLQDVNRLVTTFAFLAVYTLGTGVAKFVFM